MEYLNKAYLLIGGNVGDSLAHLEEAVIVIQKECGNVVARSSIYETAPWGNTEQSSFLNQALQLDTDLTAPHLMRKLLSIEEQMGRVRKEKYGPRVIDLDIIFFNESVYRSPEITIPHKELQNRRFVLQPLAEIAAGYVHPVLMKSVQQLLDDCKDDSLVIKLISS